MVSTRSASLISAGKNTRSRDSAVDPKRKMGVRGWAQHLLIDHAPITGWILRLLVVYVTISLESGEVAWLPSGVTYTDVDYHVFTDAAHHVAQGHSPYRRHTYRYTPFLAALLSFAEQEKSTTRTSLLEWRNERIFGKLLFCTADAICGYIIWKLRQQQRRRGKKKHTECDSDKDGKWDRFLDAMWWLYNPLAINICTRGSAESLVVLLPVLLGLALTYTEDKKNSKYRNIGFAVLGGILHGISVHAKLYPLIYTVSFMAYWSTRHLSGQQEHVDNIESKMVSTERDTVCRWSDTMPLPNGPGSQDTVTFLVFPWTDIRRLLQLVWLWIKRLFGTLCPLIFLLSFVGTFVLLTYLAYQIYGPESLQEGLLYHASRVDHRHNYAMFWYLIYLVRARAVTAISESATVSMAAMSRILLLPQAILLLYTSLGVAPHDLTLALFIQTFLFVAHNKVITAQYFTWYLSLLPLCASRIQWTSSFRMIFALIYLAVSILMWLGSAYCLEMLGLAVHRIVWVASVNFFAANVNLMGAILSNYKNSGFKIAEHTRIRPGGEVVKETSPSSRIAKVKFL